jgi:ABC-type multidrug transport system fused ATPase/permease subunit
MVSCTDEEMGLSDEQVPLLSLSAEDVEALEGDEVSTCGDIVQFSAPMYFVDEGEGYLKVDVIRLGTMAGRVGVKFTTKDGSAKQSEQYESSSGQLIFEDGEHTQTMQIPILHDEFWSPTLEFSVCLEQPQNCKLGLYLQEARVKILNSDPFPTEKYAKQVEGGEATVLAIEDWGLFREYLKLNFSAAPGVKWKSVFVVLCDQLNNIFIFGSLWVGVYIVDTLFARNPTSSKELLLKDRYHTAVMIGLWFVLPLLVLHGWQSVKIYLDIRGSSRMFLQNAVLKTYLDYTQESRVKVSAAQLDMSIDDGAEACAASYVAALNIASIIGRIITVALFIVLFQPDPFPIYAVFTMPAVLIIFTVLRVGISQRTQKHADGKMLFVVTLTNEAFHKFRLIADYFKRPLIGDMFSKAVSCHADAKVPVDMIEMNNEFVTKFLCGMVILVYIVIKTPEVLSGHLSLGVFLATIAIFSDHMASAIRDLNTQLMVIISAFMPLKEFTIFLNEPLELQGMKSINRYRRQETKQCRNEILKERGGSFRSDSIPISVHNLSFQYSGGSPVLENVNISVPQGGVIAVIGPQNSGKETFLSLLSNHLVPTCGHVYVPSHLRVLHVSREPMFLRASLLHNLILGLPSSMIDVSRIKNILMVLGLSDLIPWLQEDEIGLGSVCKDRNSSSSNFEISEQLETWHRILNQSRKARLHIARAIISNPEVMVLQRPFQPFLEDAACDVLDILRRHVQERGLFFPEEDRESRRPCSVFFSTESMAQAAQADTIWQMKPETKNIVSTTPQSLLEVNTPRTKSIIKPYFEHASQGVASSDRSRWDLSISRLA